LAFTNVFKLFLLNVIINQSLQAKFENFLIFLSYLLDNMQVARPGRQETSLSQRAWQFHIYKNEGKKY
jgi:hypothetical protein